MAAHSSTAERSAEIDRCLELISPAQPDESKFVGMLLLPRLLSHDQVDLVQRVFDGMNFKFIERLLRTSAVDSETGQVPEPVLREIAINVLACFAHYENMASSKMMADRIPALSTVLKEDDKSDGTREALHILLCVSVTKEGLVRMLDPDVLKNVMELAVATKNGQEQELGFQLIHSTFARACHMLHEKPIPSLESALKYSLPTLFTALSKVLANNQDKLKFKTLNVLSSVLPDVPSEIMQKFKESGQDKVSRWLQDLRSGLRQIFSTRLDVKYRDQSMVVTACLLQYFGPDWLFSTLRKTKSERRKSEKKPANSAPSSNDADVKFPVLLIHLVAVETRVMLDDIHERRLKLHNQEVVEVDAEKEMRQETMVPVCFEILEAAIQYLSLNYSEDQESDMDADILLKIRTVLTDTMNIVMELLRFTQDTTTSDDELEGDMIAQASMRIVALYLAEEGYELE
ncbi:Neurochondrin-domain-containing protein [Zychaea mexicana]|uniref:Neurochondrin-domain-containing protein n=1 Tax=Zychaea mexicana TaxID=64656 RepID=UPI0022FEDA36|nr:Neurochondrin-domain-containing protein [Zychaea mexicana]KAI9495758.1 Neurochondrin-domain-containing protein [Zychaea mexicana]